MTGTFSRARAPEQQTLCPTCARTSLRALPFPALPACQCVAVRCSRRSSVPGQAIFPLRLRSRVTARERKRRRLIREAEALERTAAAIRASLVSKRGSARGARERRAALPGLVERRRRADGA